MELLIGIDEAGYGPNLGPLVITATSWEVPDDPSTCDVWSLLSDVVTQQATSSGGKLHVADSKQVYRPKGGLGRLEESALCLLRLAGIETSSFQQLWESVAVHFPAACDQEPWFADHDFALPVAGDGERIERQLRSLTQCVSKAGIVCRQVHSDMVLTERFNQLTTRWGSKGQALSRLSLRLLRTVWDPDADGRTLIAADKHGGRNRYDQLLSEVLEDRLVFRQSESRARSEYVVGQTRIFFQARAEEHFPVAVASIISKYLRELAMRAFNDFWQQQVSNLRPTAGYPVDARRFKEQIAERQSALSIGDHILWRSR